MQFVLTFQRIKETERSANILPRVADLLIRYLSGWFVLGLCGFGAKSIYRARQRIALICQCERQRMQIKETITTPSILLIGATHSG